jgi:hypothetical protein
MKKQKKDYFEGRKVYELTAEEQNACISKKEGNACRHKAEKRWYRRLVVLNILIIVAVIAALVGNFENTKDGYTMPRCLCLADTSYLYEDRLPLIYNHAIKI